MSSTIFAAFLLLFAGTVVSGQRCNCNFISHPQTRVCEANFAFRGEILSAESGVLPEELDRGLLYHDHLRYIVSVNEIFKGGKQYITESIVTLYTPTSGICGKGALLDMQRQEGYENDYLFTGDIAVTSQGYKYLVITNCNWVERWVLVTKEQQEGLNGLYSNCGCEIYPRSEALDMGHTDAENFDVINCIFNPISAEVLHVADCETKFGFCVREGDDGSCSWDTSPSFTECFDSRKERLNLGAAAITNKKGCDLYTGRKKKRCLFKLKFSKSKNF